MEVFPLHVVGKLRHLFTICLSVSEFQNMKAVNKSSCGVEFFVLKEGSQKSFLVAQLKLPSEISTSETYESGQREMTAKQVENSQLKRGERKRNSSTYKLFYFFPVIL